MDLQYRDLLLAQNLVKLYRSGVRDFSNKKIWGNLTGEDLSNSNFSNCDFYADQLERANLSNTNFENANLYRVNLGHANLENANFKNVVIKSDFRNSFKGVNLCNANLSKVSFEGVDFTGASLQRAILQETVFWYVNLKDADLTEVNLKDSVFKCVYWLNTQIDNIEVLPEKELLSWQLVNQLIVDEDLTGIDLSEVNLETANLEGINLSGVNLTRARLSKINLANANLQDSNLHQAYLLGANLKNTSLIDADLSVAHLAGADLSNANLSNANLRQAKLNNAVLNDTNLENANLTSASVFHAKLHKAINVPSNIISTYKPLSIDNPNKELIKAMKEASKGLYHPSEASEPYEVFLWEQKHFGDFSLDRLLELTANLKLVDLNDFENSISAINMNIPNPQIMIEEANQLGNAFKSIIKSISSCLTNVDLYQFETIAINDYSRIMPHIAIAKIVNGDWLAITTLFEDELHQEYTQNCQPQNKTTDIQNNEINRKLIKVLTESLEQANALLPDLIISKSFCWSLERKREIALQNLLLATKHFTIFEFDDFFALGISDSPEENLKRQTLHNLVTSNLEKLRVYRIGSSNMDFYLIGQAKNKDWIGIRTEVTWT